MIITRRTHLAATTALKASLAGFYAYHIPSDQPGVRAVPAHIAAKAKGLGLNIGKLAITTPAGRA